jgi:putative nucleotidyltransferase with HDIG domain
MQAGAADYLVKPVPIEELSGSLRRALDKRKAIQEGKEHQLELEQAVARRTAELARANEGLRTEIAERRRAEEALRNATMAMLGTLSSLIEAKDPYTAGHTQRVTGYAVEVGKRMGLSNPEVETLRIAGLLHDVGKVGIPDVTLNKPTRLTRAEWMMMHAHPVESASLAEQVDAFREAAPTIRHHHENWDGTGYPDGLRGEAIPLLARILAVADRYEAMTSDRPYRKALSREQAVDELRAAAGVTLDGSVVAVYIDLLDKGVV